MLGGENRHQFGVIVETAHDVPQAHGLTRMGVNPPMTSRIATPTRQDEVRRLMQSRHLCDRSLR